MRSISGPNALNATSASFSAIALHRGAALLLLGGVCARTGHSSAPVVHVPLSMAPLLARSSVVAQDFGALLHDNPGGFADVNFRVGDALFAAHRAILSARSEYFRVMLTGRCRESSGDGREVPLSGVSAAAFRAVLAWLYTGRVELPGDCSAEMEMLEACSLFMLTDLSILLVEHIVLSLEAQTVLAWLQVALKLAAVPEVAPLRAACVSFLTAQLAARGPAAERLMAELRAAEGLPQSILFDLLESAALGKRARAPE